MEKLTYQQILASDQLNDLDRRLIENATKAEADALIDSGSYGRKRKTAALEKMAREDAERFFAQDVHQFREGHVAFTASYALSHRERATMAWAVARILAGKRNEEVI